MTWSMATGSVRMLLAEPATGGVRAAMIAPTTAILRLPKRRKQTKYPSATAAPMQKALSQCQERGLYRVFGVR